MENKFHKGMADIEELKEIVRRLVEAGTHDLFLMTTADYPIDVIPFAVGSEIKKILPPTKCSRGQYR